MSSNPDQKVAGDVPVQADLILGNPASTAKIVEEGKYDGGKVGQSGARQGPDLGNCRHWPSSLCVSERTIVREISVKYNAKS